MVTQEKHAMEIVLDSSVIAFTCGQFTVDGRTMPALVYVHRDRVVVYYKLELKVCNHHFELIPINGNHLFRIGGAHRDPSRDEEGPGITANAGRSQDPISVV